MRLAERLGLPAKLHRVQSKDTRVLVIPVRPFLTRYDFIGIPSLLQRVALLSHLLALKSSSNRRKVTPNGLRGRKGLLLHWQTPLPQTASL